MSVRLSLVTQRKGLSITVDSSLDAIEMPLSAPVCSISEYLTSKIALNYWKDWGSRVLCERE